MQEQLGDNCGNVLECQSPEVNSKNRVLNVAVLKQPPSKVNFFKFQACYRRRLETGSAAKVDLNPN